MDPSNRTFHSLYRSLSGGNGHFDISDGGEHDWATWSSQLVAMSADLVGAIA